MTPMFVETLGTQGPAESTAGPSQPGRAAGQIRATQANLEFTQTQAAGTRMQPPAVHPQHVGHQGQAGGFQDMISYDCANNC